MTIIGAPDNSTASEIIAAARIEIIQEYTPVVFPVLTTTDPALLVVCSNGNYRGFFVIIKTDGSVVNESDKQIASAIGAENYKTAIIRSRAALSDFVRWYFNTEIIQL